MKPHFYAFSFTHHKVELGLREQLKLSEGDKAQFLLKIRKTIGVQEFFVLDTCNRWELYLLTEFPQAKNHVWTVIKDTFALSDQQLEKIVTVYRESQAVQHLFEVSSGVDSQMIGETEIIRQVKASFSDAKEQGDLGSTLHRLVTKAFQAAKWVRTHTLIGQGTVSIGNVSVDLAQRIFGDLSDRKVLLVGSGEVGRLTAQALKNRSAKSITFTSRTYQNAQDLQQRIGGDVFAYDELFDRLYEYDIVITSTSAPSHILGKKDLKPIMKKRSYRPLFLIDLAMPRDVDPIVAKLPQVFLYNLDDVSEIANENMDNRSHEIDSCKKTLSAKAWHSWLDVNRRYRMRAFHNRYRENG